MAEIDTLLSRMADMDASDLHLKVGAQPCFRMRGDLERFEGRAALTHDDIDRMAGEILSELQRRRWRERGEIDFGYGDAHSGRFRVAYYHDRHGPAAAFRRIPGSIPELRDLNLPESIGDFAHLPGGLVLVTGATGSGKTTTLASLLDVINTHYRKHIITLEDPVEYLLESKKSLVHQRAVHDDVPDFAPGIRAAMRETPDVLMIGELRDTDSVRQALSAAELGTLIFATLHTNGAAASCDRIIDVFPADEQPQMRAMLAQSLAGVLSQVLLKRIDRPGRIPAVEVLVGGPAVSTLIRENKVHEIPSVMQVGHAQKMQTLDDALESLVRRRVVSPEEAYGYARNKPRFEQLLSPAAR